METKKLTEVLVADGKAVVPVSSPLRRTGIFALTGLTLLAGYVAVIGSPVLRELSPLSIEFLVPLFCLLFMFISAAHTAVRLSVPGLEVRDREIATFGGAFALWMGFLASTLGSDEYGVLFAAANAHEPEYMCCIVMFVASAIVMPVAAYLLCRGAPTRPIVCALSAVFACASLAALALHFVCANCAGEHVLVWHVIPLFVVPGILVLLGRRFFRKASLI